MICQCRYDENVDVSLVAEGLAIDLQKAIENGVVLDSSINLDVNDIDNPNDVWCRVHDAFEAIDRERQLLGMKTKAVQQQQQQQSTSQQVS